MNDRESLMHSLKIRYGIPPGEINDKSLQDIIDYVYQKGGLSPSNSLWSEAVYKYCPKAGQYKYGGLDNSDINALLIQATKK